MEFDDKTFVLGVGAQKAGTSWLFDYLSGRGDIYMPRKELHFFDVRFGPLAAHKQRKISRRAVESTRGKNEWLAIKVSGDPELYREYFRSRTPGDLRLFGEISPAYAMIGDEGFSTVRKLFPKVRIIFLMRDPITRFCSQISMEIKRMGTTLKLEKFVEKHSADMLERSQYEKTLSSLDRVFAPSELIYLFYETLFCRNSVQSLCDFLEIPYSEPDFQKVINAGERLPPAIDEDIIAKLKPTYRFCRERFGTDLPGAWRDLG